MRRTAPAVLMLALTVLWSGGCAGPDARLAAALDPILERHRDTGAVVHARVVEIDSGRVLYARHEDVPCTPASNLKLLTSAAGLDLFGSRHVLRTWLAIDGDNLLIVGSGDPGPGDYRLSAASGEVPTAMLDRWVEALRRRGVNRIDGDIVYDDSALEARQTHPTWRNFLTHWYAAPVSGLNFNDNCVDITIFPTAPGRPVRYEVMPPVRDIDVINGCLTGTPHAPTIEKQHNANIYRLGGTCQERTALKSKPVNDPGAFFADALRTRLEAGGILVRGSIRRADARAAGGAAPPPAGSVVAVHETPITDVLWRINKNSQNLFADCLCKMSGREWERRRGRLVPGSWESGARAAYDFLRRQGIDARGVVLADGSGLSRDNRVTARMLSDLLTRMFRRPDAHVFRASLSAAGVDGSLGQRMTDLKGHVFGKTGYIGGVSSTSGYVRTRRGRWLAFSFVYNDIPEKTEDDSDVKEFTRLQDEACRVLVAWPDAVPASAPATASAAGE